MCDFDGSCNICDINATSAPHEVTNFFSFLLLVDAGDAKYDFGEDGKAMFLDTLTRDQVQRTSEHDICRAKLRSDVPLRSSHRPPSTKLHKSP